MWQRQVELWSSLSLNNFINILRMHFLFESLLLSFSLITIWLCNFLAKDIDAKAAHKMLIKLKIDIHIFPIFSNLIFLVFSLSLKLLFKNFVGQHTGRGKGKIIAGVTSQFYHRSFIIVSVTHVLIATLDSFVLVILICPCILYFKSFK